MNKFLLLLPFFYTAIQGLKAQDPILLIPLQLDSTYLGQEYFNDVGGGQSSYEEYAVAYDYDNQGRLVQRRTYNWNNIGSNIQYRASYSYDGNIATALLESKTGINDWSLYARRKEYLNAENKWDSVFIDNFVSGEWKQSSRTDYRYNASGFEIYQGAQFWKEDQQKWVYHREYIHDFDSNQNLVLFQHIFWYSDTTGTILNEDTYEYDIEGRVVKIIWKHSAGGSLIESRIILYGYSPDNLSDTITHYEKSLGSWKPNYRIIRHYDADGLLFEHYHDIYETGIWKNASKTLFTPGTSPYSSSPSLELTQGFDMNTQVYSDAARLTRSFEDLPNNQVFYESRDEFHDYVTQLWEERKIYQIWYNLLQPAQTEDFTQHHQVCQFPNPYSPGQIIRCDLNPKWQYTLRLFSLDGKMILERKFQGNEGWQITGPITEGLYIVAVFQNNRLIDSQKLVID